MVVDQKLQRVDLEGIVGDILNFKTGFEALPRDHHVLLDANHDRRAQAVLGGGSTGGMQTC